MISVPRCKHWSYEEREKVMSFYKWRKQYNRELNQQFLSWIDKLLVMGVIEPRDWDYETGKFYGYPSCCIKWFVFLDKMGTIPGKMTDYLYGETHCDYVQCPKCIKEGV